MRRQTRIITLLAIDTVFFLVEIIVGYMVHSLALVADSFHMLNDVMSLIVALYAIKLAARQTTSPKYSYGWQRAEILGALINGVFLLALCLSIFLEAVQRFFEPQTITKPVLILAVGGAGLASNIIGLVLFHEHSHGGHSRSHGDSHEPNNIHSHDLESGPVETHHLDDSEPTGSASPNSIHPSDERGNIAEILPQTIVRRASSPKTVRVDTQSLSASRRSVHRRSRQSFASADDIFVSPAANRLSIVSQAQEIQNQARHDETEDSAEGEGENGYNADPICSMQQKQSAPSSTATKRPGGHLHRRTSSIKHDKHNHAKPRDAKKSRGHSHQNLNMRGVFLHVLGDALGNIGVIATALFIWLTDFSWRFYADPVISLVITAIIFSSALPLVKSASLILLQGVPMGISLDDVKEDILEIDGVENVHELHIWQLSDIKLIASVHIGVNLPKLHRIKRYHQIAKAIRACLHAYGIHSSTIQPEFSDRPPLPGTHNREEVITDDEEETPLLDDGGKSCMFECGADCVDNRCCDGAKIKKGGAAVAGTVVEGNSVSGARTYGGVNGSGAKASK